MEENKKQLTEYSIWDVLGLDLTEEDKESMLEDLIEAAWMDLIDNGLKEKLGEQKYNELFENLKSQNLGTEEFVQAVKDKLTIMNLDIDTELDKSMEKVLKEFIQDQVTYLEKRVNGIKEQTEREVKLSLIKTLWDMISTEQWDQMGDIFRKVDGYQLPEGLVLHL